MIDEAFGERWGRRLVVWIGLAHLALTTFVLPPWGDWGGRFLAQVDFPVHAHRALVYRESLEAGDRPWGIDPRVNAGLFLHPTQDVGSTPYQLLALLWPGGDTSRSIAIFVWLAVGLAPSAVLVAGRLAGLDWEESAWCLGLATATIWLSPLHRVMFRVGMASYLSSSFLAVLVWALYDRVGRGPSLRGLASATAGGAALFLLHPFGPAPIVPALGLLVLTAPHWTWRQRAVVAATPLAIAAVNAFWLLPVLDGLSSPPPPWADRLQIHHPYFNWQRGGGLSDWLGAKSLLLHAATIAAMIAGATALGRRRGRTTAIGAGVAAASALLLFLFGSRWPALQILQPVRFGAVFWNMAAVLGAVGVTAMFKRWREAERVEVRRLAERATTATMILAGVGLFGAAVWYRPRFDNSLDTQAWLAFVETRTAPEQRLLCESFGKDRMAGHVTPEYYGREVVSDSFPDRSDPIQFASGRLFGRSRDGWTADELRAALDRFGVAWAMVYSADWHELFCEATGSAGEPVGSGRVYRCASDGSRFLIGRGRATASVNRIELQDLEAEEGRVVLRYRYHPGWVCDPPATLASYPIPEGGGGLLAIVQPPARMTLRFDPRRALHAEWPAASLRAPSAGAGGVERSLAPQEVQAGDE